MDRNKYLLICFNALFYCLQSYGTSQLKNGTEPMPNLIFGEAKWIVADSINYPSGTGAPVFRNIIRIIKKVSKARLLITAHGIHDITLKGIKVGNGLFTPGFTAYHYRLQYQTYDVSNYFKDKPDSAELKVTVGDGWWRGRFGNGGKYNNFGNEAALLCRLIIEYADGNVQEVVSDESWEVGSGPIRASELYDGELYDARIVYQDFNPVKVVDYRFDNLVPTIGNPVRRQEILPAAKLLPGGIIDFGQNIAGWIKFSVRGNRGDTVRVYHGEALDSIGGLFRKNLRTAKAVDTYILSGKGKETFEPHFTYHGFRYIKVEGCKPNLKDFKAIVLHTELQKTGDFSCSDPRLNQLHSNILWSMKGNFVDIPTDCPQRSERLGWTEDADVFCSTASYLMNVKDFYTKWLEDLKAEQHLSGSVSPTIPSFWGNNTIAIAGWGDAATFTPWTLYQRYGDTTILSRQYSSMKAWVDYLGDEESGYVSKASLKRFGDWYPPGPETPLAYLNQCYYYRSTWIVLETARLLGNAEDVTKYTIVLNKVRNAFNKTWSGKIPQTQTAYVIGIHFGLLPASDVSYLVELIKENNYHLATGFMGTPYLMHVLSSNGHSDIAYKLLTQDTPPSWLYMVKKGATTMWEMWDAVREDGSFAKGGDVSLNHYAFGSIGIWMYENIAGIKPIAPGYSKVLIKPGVGGGLTWANGSYISSYGKISSSWKVKKGKFTLSVEIPPGVNAEIILPSEATGRQVGAGKHQFSCVIGNS